MLIGDEVFGQARAKKSTTAGYPNVQANLPPRPELNDVRKTAFRASKSVDRIDENQNRQNRRGAEGGPVERKSKQGGSITFDDPGHWIQHE